MKDFQILWIFFGETLFLFLKIRTRSDYTKLDNIYFQFWTTKNLYHFEFISYFDFLWTVLIERFFRSIMKYDNSPAQPTSSWNLKTVIVWPWWLVISIQ